MDQDYLISGLDEVLGTGEPENEYVARIMNEYGPPAFLNDKGRISKLGEPFWAALRAHETHTIFSPKRTPFTATTIATDSTARSPKAHYALISPIGF